MGKMLVVLTEGGVMESLQDGHGPFDVQMIDCQNGVAGDVFVLPQSWRPLAEQFFGGVVPPYVRFDQDLIDDRRVRAQHLLERVKSDLTELRELSDEPFCLPVTPGGEISIEIRPLSEDNRVTVGCRWMGDTVVNYADDGLVIDVFDANEALRPVRSMYFDAADLQGESLRENF